jgi:putative tryptophan/tyrosine transport system substrate-binding protein
VQVAAQSLVGRADNLAVLSDKTAVTALEAIVKVCDDNHIPLLAGDTDSVRCGAAVGSAFDYEDLGRLAAYQAAAILGGTPVADVPVEFADRLELSVNVKAAAAQGLTLPADLVARAGHRF